MTCSKIEPILYSAISTVEWLHLMALLMSTVKVGSMTPGKAKKREVFEGIAFGICISFTQDRHEHLLSLLSETYMVMTETKEPFL